MSGLIARKLFPILPRGEITVVVAPVEKPAPGAGGELSGDFDDETLGRFVNWLAEERNIKRKAAAELAAGLLGVPRNRAGNALLDRE